MKRIYPAHAFSDAPRAGCYWDTTTNIAETGPLREPMRVDVAIIGAGFTGLNAAIELVGRGADVAVFDAKSPGWGASGRNGGFCCLGGSKSGDAELDARFGRDARLEWRATEVAAVRQVETFLAETGTDADVHSNGETQLAHRAKDAAGFEAEARAIEENYGVTADVLTKDQLAQDGLRSTFHGAITTPIGIGLNPRKYVAGLVTDALRRGVRIYSETPITGCDRQAGQRHLQAGGHKVSADQVIVATNGYSSEGIPKWLAGRYMPTQSSVAVTRPMSEGELAAQGWRSGQMCYDTRNLLHYFRLMPNNRMLFGLRGGLLGTAASDARAYARLRSDFDRMFPSWSQVAFDHCWTGMVCLSRNRTPFVGAVPDMPGVFAAMCYHGNGVAMGSHGGRLVGRLVGGDAGLQIPAVLQRPLERFPLGRARRVLMWPVYAALKFKDL